MTCSIALTGKMFSILSALGIKKLTASVHHFDDLVQDHERSLQASKFDKRFHSSGIRLSASLHLLSSFAQACQPKVVVAFG
jgi:hypothetical protein